MSLRRLLVTAALGWLVAGCARVEPADPQPPAPAMAQPTPPPAEPAPKQAAEATAKLHFVAYGDCRSRPEKHRLVAERIAQLKPEVVLQTGDLVGDGSKPEEWKQALEIIKPLRAGGKYYAAMGNHEKKFTYLREELDPPADPDKTYYSVLAANCRFIMVDTTTLRLDQGDPAQLAWIKAELAKPRGADEHLFVVQHHPAYTVGSYGPGDLAVRARLHKLYVAAGVEAVFCGHDHLYYRTERDGVMYVVTGGGGAPLYDPKPSLVGPNDVARKTLHFVDCQVTGAKLAAQAIDDSGAVFDHFVTQVRAAQPPAEKPAPKPAPAKK